MRLQGIKIDQCPICGCMDVVCEKQHHQHCNGLFNEEREWSCHYTLRYSPNLRKVEVVRLCKKDPKYIKMEKDKEHIVQTMTDALIKIGYKENKIEIRHYYSTLHKWNFSVNILRD